MSNGGNSLHNVLHGINLILYYLLKTIYVGTDKNNTITVQIAPPSDATEGDKNVSIFCYKIMEYPFSKTQKPFLKNFDKIQFPPLVLDLSYLITVNMDPKKEEETSDILGKILRLFHDNASLSGIQLEELRKDNNGIFNEYYKNVELKIILNQLQLEELNHLWTLFPGIKYKTSLSYTVSPVIIPSEREMNTTLVRSQILNYYG